MQYREYTVSFSPCGVINACSKTNTKSDSNMIKQKRSCVLSFLNTSNSTFFCADATHISALLHFIHRHSQSLLLHHPIASLRASITYISTIVADLIFMYSLATPRNTLPSLHQKHMCAFKLDYVQEGFQEDITPNSWVISNFLRVTSIGIESVAGIASSSFCIRPISIKSETRSTSSHDVS